MTYFYYAMFILNIVCMFMGAVAGSVPLVLFNGGLLAFNFYVAKHRGYL